MNASTFTTNVDYANATAPVITSANAIFDATPYIAPKATIDGNLADEIAVKFGGTWEPPVEWFDKAKLGHTVTLTIEAEIVGKSATLKSGEDAQVVGTASLKVIDVYLPAPENLV